MEQIEHRSAPAGEFGNQDDVDLAGLRQCEDRLAFGAFVLGSGGGFFPDPGDFVAGLFGEGAQIAFLSGTGLVGGRYPTIQRCGLSQLNPPRPTPRKRDFSCGRVLVYSKYTSKGTGMPHRELLTEPQRVSFHAPASDEREMVRHYTLSSEDLALINRRRGDPNRLGFALMLCYLRFPGRILQQGEQSPAALCAFVAEQLGVDPAQFGDYAERDQTRREHIVEIQTALGFRAMTSSMYREVSAWLLPTALATDHGPTLVATVLEELRVRRIVCPPLPAIERLGGSVRARAQRQLWGWLADGLTDRQRQGLDQLLEVRVGGGQSTLAWLRQTAYAATSGNFPKLIERLNQLRALGIEPERATRVHQNYWLKLAREGGQSTVQHLAELEPLRRYATLTALVLDLTATLTDEALNMFEHLIGKLFKKSERAHADEFHASGKSLNEKVRLYARIGKALIAARSSGGDAFAAIEAVLSWSKFASTVAEAQILAQPEEFDYLGLLNERYGTVRKFAPLLLAHFEFHAAPAAAELLQALNLLRDLNASGKRALPEHVPTGFVKPRWRPHVFAVGGVDRHF